MAEYFLKPKSVGMVGPQEGEIRLTITDGVMSFSQYSDGAWAALTFATGSLSQSQVIQAANAAAFPETGSASALYLAIDTEILYYWDGEDYAQCVGGT